MPTALPWFMRYGDRNNLNIPSTASLACERLKLGGGLAYDRSADLTAVSEQLHKLRHNLLHKPALTGNLCMTCINVT
jgi:hypothetical protein